MKTLIHLFLTFLFLLPIVNAQEQHTYSSKEVVYYNYIKKTTNSDAPYHWGESDGHRCGAYEYNYNIRNINFWEWNYSNIPVQATVTSVTLRFRASKNHSHNFSFKLYNIPYSRSNSAINFYNECTNERTIFSSPVYSPDENNTIYYNQTFTEQSPIGQGWEIWNAINSAVQSGNYYFTIGIQENLPSLYNHWWISGYDGGYSASPAIDLIINFTTPDNYYTFKNKIQSTENYDSLILNNNLQNPITSGSVPVFLPWGSPNTIRTNVLPFSVNWNNTNTVQKHNYWELQSSSFDYSLHHNFQAISSSPSEFKATFLQTSTAVIKNYLTEVSNTTFGNVGIIDPWFYYEDEGGQWVQDGAPHFYSSPINIQNNATDSYGGVFLNQNPDPNNPNKPYYSVKVDAVQNIPLYNTGVPTGNGRTHKFYFQNWSGSNVNFQNSNALETPVVFTQDGAFAQAKLKGTQLSTTANAFNSNSQRKYVKSDDGYLHLVYESMGSVWYEVSPDNGATWYIQNNGKPISVTGKQPAIDYGSFYDQSTQETYYQTAITWQESYGSSSSKIKVAYFDRFEGVPIGRMNWRDTKDIATVSGSYSTTNCYPVICMAYSNFNIVYKNGAAGALLSRTGVVNISYGIYFSINNPLTLTGTNSYSVNPSIAVNKSGTTSIRLV